MERFVCLRSFDCEKKIIPMNRQIIAGLPTRSNGQTLAMDDAVLARLDSMPRQPFGFYPTPFERAPRLAHALSPQPPRLFLKRDDYTGFGLGGNKVRKLEYVLTPERMAHTDVIITSGGVQSNHARVTAACAAKLGKRCILVLNGARAAQPRGNALLQSMYGAEIVYVGSRDERAPRTELIAEELRVGGVRPLVVPIGASNGEGALGYVRAALELKAQLAEAGTDGAVWVFISASSCGTLAGLLLGVTLAGMSHVQLVGMSADATAEEIVSESRRIAQEAGSLLGWKGALPEHAPLASAAFVGDGYGIPTPQSREAIEMFARLEGCVLDPVYSSKAAAGMIAWMRADRFDPQDTVVFWHTGGVPAVFAS
jgi:1-aminocyclopropane-1-carboxylate deaminase/D-cysteine desulfhydrase-like pyridoxal-dependent ACC family enzyme